MDPISSDPTPIHHSGDHFPDPITVHSNSHPPYAEMITAAITALKDRDGSSRQAISKYIEQHFTSLPPTHSTLLTHHLKRLKNLGDLVMVKHSYMLPLPPGSAHFQPVMDFGTGITDASAAASGFGSDNLPAGSSVKRKPGRPPKLKPVPNVQGYSGDVAQGYQPQFQYHQAGVGGGEDVNYGAAGGVAGSEPLFASLGLADDGVVEAPLMRPPAAGEGTPAVVKRGRGRPPKSAGGAGNQALVVSSDGGGVEAGAGRVGRKANGARVKRGRGRPRRVGFGAVTVPLSGNSLRPRGRPKRVGRPNLAVNGGASQGVVGARRRGRPSRKVAAGLTGKPLGGISKSGPGTAVIVTDPEQLVVYQELKSKYVHLQSKVKQVASVVKSCIDPDYGNTALGALQELEDLAAEANKPSNGQTH